jgi:hypothetical protein
VILIRITRNYLIVTIVKRNCDGVSNPVGGTTSILVVPTARAVNLVFIDVALFSKTNKPGSIVPFAGFELVTVTDALKPPLSS